MGGLYETDRMLRHVESCAQCQAAPDYVDRCDDWHGMANNLMDWECSEGPFEDGQDMCPVCDGPLDNDGFCAACDQHYPTTAEAPIVSGPIDFSRYKQGETVQQYLERIEREDAKAQ
jgi:hypothetical protein